MSSIFFGIGLRYQSPLPRSELAEVASAKKAAVDWLRSEIDRNTHDFYVFAGGDYGNNRALYHGFFSETGGGYASDDFAPLPVSMRESPTPNASRVNGTYAKRWEVDLAQNAWASLNFQTGFLEDADTGSVGPSSGRTAVSKVDLSRHKTLHLTLWAESDDDGTAVTIRTGDATPDHPDTLTRTLATGVTLSSSSSPKHLSFDLSGDDMSSMDTFLTLDVDRDFAPAKKHAVYVAAVYYEQPRDTVSDVPTPTVFDAHGCWLKSWTTQKPARDFDIVMQNVAFVYDQALALMTLLSAAEDEAAAGHSVAAKKDLRRAAWLARAVVHAANNDPTYTHDGRVRNAYRCGPAAAVPGFEADDDGKGGARLPGWWSRIGVTADGEEVMVGGEEGTWAQDKYAVSTWTGNAAWACLALITMHEHLRRDDYYSDATDAAQVPDIAPTVRGLAGFLRRMAVHDDDGYGGFSGGLFGFDGETQERLGWRSTEHASDVHAVASALAQSAGSLVTTRESGRWARLARHARRFVDAMFHDGYLPDGSRGTLYWTGVTSDGNGSAINTSVLPLDATLWAVYGADRTDAPRLAALDWVHRQMRVTSGGSTTSLAKYSRASQNGWIEDTAQLAVAFREYGLVRPALDALRACLPHRPAAHGEGDDQTDGSFYSVDEELDTGLDLPGGGEDAWTYLRRPHVGATCWFALAAAARNPFRQ